MTDNSDGWPRLPDDVVSALPEHEQILIRRHEEETIAASKMQLADICANCHIKPQFAKTFRVLRRDLRNTLNDARANLAQPNSGFSDAFGVALIRSTDEIVSHKLDLMGRHFFMRWGELVENWAGEEGSTLDGAGCCVFLAVAASGLGLGAWLFLLVRA